MDIGLVGVGYIGKEFVDRVAETDHSLAVFDIDDEQVAYATDRGSEPADSPAAVAERSEAVVLALPDSPAVEAVFEGDDGLLAGLEAGGLVLDVTTTHPDTSTACEALCDERGIDFLEAPITGGAPREGYHMMVGGTEERYERAADLLDVLCDDHVRVGPVPDATLFKLALQLRYAGRAALDAEIVAFLRDNGVDPRHFTDFLGMDVWERYFERDFEQEIEGLGGLSIWHKDLGYLRDVADERGTALPLGDEVYQAYKATVRRTADDDESDGDAVKTNPEQGHAAALLRYWELLNGREATERRE